MIRADKIGDLLFLGFKSKRMKQIAGLLFVVLVFTHCQKELVDERSPYIQVLRSKMLAGDFKMIEVSTVRLYTMQENNQVMLRAKMGKEELVVLFSHRMEIVSGKVVGYIADMGQPGSGQGHLRELDGNKSIDFRIRDGRVVTDPGILTMNSAMAEDECLDCTIPEFIVATSYYNGVLENIPCYSLYWITGNHSNYDDYLPMYSDIGGGGAPMTIDFIESTDKEKIEVKKYTDCFGQISGDMATYTITIAADLPVDRNSCIFFDWKERFPGHAYVELSKSNPYSTVRQSFGFYPGVSYKVLTGHDINSKVVNDGGHEYQAKYTISVSPAQFEAAVQKLQEESTRSYNVSYYNCVDFALAVFNAGGGNLGVPRYSIPAFGVPGGSSSPQGLYDQIKGMQLQGNPMAYTTPNKEYIQTSNGPCN